MKNKKRVNQSPKITKGGNDEVKSITISAVGDCCLGTDNKYPYSNSLDDIYQKSPKDFLYVFKYVKPIFEQDDLTIANLETTLTTAASKKRKRFAFRGNPAYVNYLKAGSVEAVNIANNHILDYWEEGYLETLKHLKEAGIKYFGSDVSHKPYYENKLIETVKGVKIGLLGYNYWPYVSGATKKLAKDLAQIKENCDLAIVSFHWGKEFTHYPAPRQRKLAHFAIDHGADLILGHHPHVIQGIEVYKNKSIVYSLGNFCFGQFNFRDGDSFIYQHTFTFNNNRLIKESNQIIPCSISSVKKTNNCQPTPLAGQDKMRVLSRINKYSQM